MTKKPQHYRIGVMQAGPGLYAVKGAVTIKAAFSPIREAALELLSKGADPPAKLVVDAGVSIVPRDLASLARAYCPPRNQQAVANGSVERRPY